MSNTPPAERGPAKAGGYRAGAAAVVIVTVACISLVVFLLLSGTPDTGIRVWVLNHAPDQIVIVNPYNGQVEKKFQVADGLKRQS